MARQANEEWRRSCPLRRWNPTDDLKLAADLGLTKDRYLELLAGADVMGYEQLTITERIDITWEEWENWVEARPAVSL